MAKFVRRTAKARATPKRCGAKTIKNAVVKAAKNGSAGKDGRLQRRKACPKIPAKVSTGGKVPSRIAKPDPNPAPATAEPIRSWTYCLGWDGTVQRLRVGPQPIRRSFQEILEAGIHAFTGTGHEAGTSL